MNTKLIDTQNRLVVARGRVSGGGEIDKGHQKVQIYSYKMSSEDNIYSTVTIVNNIVLHI